MRVNFEKDNSKILKKFPQRHALQYVFNVISQRGAGKSLADLRKTCFSTVKEICPQFTESIKNYKNKSFYQFWNFLKLQCPEFSTEKKINFLQMIVNSSFIYQIPMKMYEKILGELRQQDGMRVTNLSAFQKEKVKHISKGFKR